MSLVARAVLVAMGTGMVGMCVAQPTSPAVRSLLEIRQEGVVMQRYDLSCGAAALATLLNTHHGEHLSEREVATGLMRRADYVQDPSLVQRREGFSLLDLKRYVESRGHIGIGYGGLSFEDLRGMAPLMVPINLGGYNHFVVYRGEIGEDVLLADPAWGNRRIRRQAFESAWVDYPGLGRVGFVVSSQVAPTSLPP